MTNPSPTLPETSEAALLIDELLYQGAEMARAQVQELVLNGRINLSTAEAAREKLARGWVFTHLMEGAIRAQLDLNALLRTAWTPMEAERVASGKPPTPVMLAALLRTIQAVMEAVALRANPVQLGDQLPPEPEVVPFRATQILTEQDLSKMTVTSVDMGVKA